MSVNVGLSRIANCDLTGRPGDPPLFSLGAGDVQVQLDGYAILPKEMLAELATPDELAALYLKHFGPSPSLHEAG